MNEKNFKKEIEAILFYRGEEVKESELASILGISEEEMVNSVSEIERDLTDRGIVLLKRDGYLSLATNSDVSPIIEKMVKEEMNRDLSQASLETLSIIVYKHPVTKKEIEYIRGVNSSFSIRNLLLRGLIERESSRLDERIYLYKPTSDLMMYLGVKSFSEIPEFDAVRSEIDRNIKENKEDEDE